MKQMLDTTRTLKLPEQMMTLTLDNTNKMVKIIVLHKYAAIFLGFTCLIPIHGFTGKSFGPPLFVAMQNGKPKLFYHLASSVMHYRVSSEDEAVSMLLDARDCANSSSCSLEEAKTYLAAVTHVQNACTSGHPVSEDACEDPLFTMELILDLKKKIESGQQASSETNKLAIIAAPAKKDPTTKYTDILVLSRFLALVYGLFLVYSVGSLPLSMYHNDDMVTKFTLEEWGYALKDGYLHSMINHYLRVGGL